MNVIQENKKIFILLFIVAIIIIVCILWLPEKDIELSHYEVLTDTDVDERVSKQYGNDLLYMFYSQDNDALSAKVMPSFLEYLDISKSNYSNWLKANGFDTYSIKFGNTTKHSYDNINIYSISTIFDGVEKKINIIEKEPENWYYTIGTFVDFDSSVIKQEKYTCGVIVNSIYQDLEYVELDCSMYVDDNGYDTIDITDVDSVKLNLTDKSSFIMATNNVNSDEFVLNNKKYVNFKCIFNIPIDYQDTISSIDFNGFYVDGEDVSINVNWNK